MAESELDMVRRSLRKVRRNIDKQRRRMAGAAAEGHATQAVEAEKAVALLEVALATNVAHFNLLKDRNERVN